MFSLNFVLTEFCINETQTVDGSLSKGSNIVYLKIAIAADNPVIILQ